MSKVTKRPQAVIDIVEVADYIALDSLDAALRFIDATETTFEFIAKNPEIGTPCRFSVPKASAVRTWPVKGFDNHLIFYQPITNGIDIIRVIHGARDIEEIFGF